MKYAIIAAGEGSRLAQEGVPAPKPLVEVGGERLIDRLVRIFTDCGATEICVICNNLTPLVARHLESMESEGKWPLRHIVKTTPSSMHSLYELSPLLGGEPFILTTVDTIFLESEFRGYVDCFSRLLNIGANAIPERWDSRADGLMGVTDFIDDEKPLYVKTSVNGLQTTDSSLKSPVNPLQSITAFCDHDDAPHFISGGIYGLTPKALATLRGCIERGESRMRNFQRALLPDGMRLLAYPFSKVLDIDHASDIAKAEQFLNGK